MAGNNDLNRALFDQISAYLAAMDLSGLFVIGSDGKPGGWLWQQLKTGVDSEAALMISLESTEEFKNRYGIISEIRAKAAAGENVHVPTVREVREYEETSKIIMRQAGLPDYMWDNWSDAHALMRNDLSLVELEQRLGAAWARVNDTPAAVRDAYARFYGIDGDAALASTFLDPERTQQFLELSSRAAYTAGMGKTMQLDLDQQVAERIAQTPRTDAGIYEGLTNVGELAGAGIFTETIAEVPDLTAEREGIGSVLLGDGTATSEIERRVIERRAQNAAVPGGAIRTERGLTGVG